MEWATTTVQLDRDQVHPVLWHETEQLADSFVGTNCDAGWYEPDDQRRRFADVHRRLGMFLPRGGYPTVVAFIEGCDQGMPAVFWPASESGWYRRWEPRQPCLVEPRRLAE